MSVTINQSLETWVLCFSLNGQVINSYTVKKLLEAIELASVLQVHIDNINDLPLRQYAEAT